VVMLVEKAHRVVVSLAVLFALFGAGEALAADPGADALAVHVVSVKSEDALDQAEALTSALRKAVRDAEGWSLADTQQSLEFLALKMGCSEPIDAACETRIADVLKADRFIWSVISFEDGAKDNVVGTVNFFVRGEGTKSANLRYSANLTDSTVDALIAVASKALQEVTGGPPKGTLRVTTGGVAAQIYIDGQPMGALSAEGGSFQIASGEHRVVVKAPGYADAEGTATVKPSTQVELSLTLVAAEESAPIDGRLVGGIAALGVGAAAGAVGLWAALEVNSVRNDPEFEDYRRQFATTADVCERAQSPDPRPDVEAMRAGIAEKCDRASTMEIVQAIMFPVAGVAAGVGIFLLGTSSLVGDDAAGDSALWIEPIITPEVQAVTVRYRF
jgi:hypothetical protein